MGLNGFDDAQGLADEAVDCGVTIAGEGLQNTVGDDGAEAQTGVAEQPAEAIDAGSLHLEVCDAVGAVGEGREPVDQVWLCEPKTQYPSLRAIEARAGDRDTLVETGGEMPEQGGAGAADIRLREPMVQLGLGGKRMEKLIFFFAEVMTIEVEEVVDAEAVCGGYEIVGGYILLQGSGGAHPDDGKGRELSFDHSGAEIDIDQRVELVQDDVDIIGADAGGDDGKALAADPAGVGDEFAMMAAMFDGIEIFRYLFHTARIPDGEDDGRQLFGPEIEVINGAASVDNEFAFRDWLHNFF
jgi:hypothetical protein